MAASTVFDDALTLLEGKFTNDPLKRKGGLLTAYAAVKRAFGVERDHHAVAYNGSRWPELDAEMKRAFAVLDGITAETSQRPVDFNVWCSRPERSEKEVRAVLSEAASRQPEFVVRERARTRPTASNSEKPRKSLAGSKKLRWVACSQLAMIAAGRKTPLGTTIKSLPLKPGMNDWDIVRMLDGIIDEDASPWEPSRDADAVVNLSRAWGTKTRNRPTYSLLNFLDDFRAEGGTLSDDDEALAASFNRFHEGHDKDKAPDYSAPLLGF